MFNLEFKKLEQDQLQLRIRTQYIGRVYEDNKEYHIERVTTLSRTTVDGDSGPWSVATTEPYGVVFKDYQMAREFCEFKMQMLPS